VHNIQPVLDQETVIAVNLEGQLISRLKQGARACSEILSISAHGAKLRTEGAVGIGEKLTLSLFYEEQLNLACVGRKYEDWKSSKKTVTVEFEKLSASDNRALKLILDYYAQLKKAGVNFSPLEFEEISRA